MCQFGDLIIWKWIYEIINTKWRFEAKSKYETFTIINDEAYWVVANFKETQIHHMKLGDEAEIKFDAYPDLTLKGKIIAFSDATGAKFSLLPPDNATGNFVKVTQRIPVKIEIEDAAKYKDKLHAGMSLDVSVAY